MVEMVDFAGAHGLARTAQALEGALDAFLQDKGLAPLALPIPRAGAVPQGVPVPDTVPVPDALPVPDAVPVPGALPVSEAAPAAIPSVAFRTDPDAVPPQTDAPASGAADAADAARKAAIAAAALAPDPVLAEAAFRTRRPVTQPRRLHLMPSQRVTV
jgi:hypothetical protein